MKDITTVDLGKGAVDSPYDIRDYWYTPPERGISDWSYDIEKILGKKLVVKDQNGSSSCGGQAWSYYGEVLEAVATKGYEPRSARWIYSHTAVPGGGSRGKDNCDFVIKNGFVQEEYATSYNNGKPPKESFMLQVPKLTKDAVEDKELSRALSYLKVQGDFNTIAQAITEHYGCIISVGGEDNGTWRSKFPKPPKSRVWGHWLYAGKLKTIKGKKYIGVINSWGTDTGESGWQYLGEDYFTSGFVREGWVLAWDYKPSQLKAALVKVVKLYEQLLSLYKIK